MKDDVLTFKCKHCDNDDLKSMIIKPIVHPNPEYKPFPYNANAQQFLNTGLFVSCAKCDKDTVVVIDDFHNNAVQVNLSEVPEKALVHVKFQKPLYSAIKYILTDDMTLDKVVVDINNQLFSVITQSFVSAEYREITPEQYKGLKEKKIEEVKPIINDRKPDVVVEGAGGKVDVRK
ncbi:MAG: hypothetical protein ACRCX2_36595 [Paraclostridium sp.]